MTPTEQALARELARHPAWRWRDGMMSNAGRVWTEAYYPGGGTRDATPRLPSGGKVSTGHYPDLADPATQGCLMASILAATGEHKILELIWDGTEFTVVDMTCVENGKRTGHWHVGWPPKYGDETTYGSAVAELWLAVQR